MIGNLRSFPSEPLVHRWIREKKFQLTCKTHVFKNIYLLRIMYLCFSDSEFTQTRISQILKICFVYLRICVFRMAPMKKIQYIQSMIN